MSTSTVPEKPDPIRRVVTGHDDKGNAVFLYDNAAKRTQYEQKPGSLAYFSVPWSSTGALPDLQTNEDQAEAKIGELIIENGTVLRYVDFPPLAVSPMHRTQSLDYGIVIYGDLEIELDNGAIKKIGPSDVVVQQGTIHAWRNVSSTNYARMVYVLIGAKEVKIDGKPLEAVTIH